MSVGVIVDMSGRDLAEGRSSFAGIVQSAMDAIITVDEEQRILLFNAAAERMFRCTAAEAIGSPIEGFIPERFRRAHAHHLANFGQTGVSSRAMGRLGVLSARRADGEEFPIEASISQVEVEGRKLFTVILRDITERLRMEEALRLSEERFRLSVEAFPSAMLMVNEVGTLILVNHGAERLFGYAREELLGQPVDILVPDRVRAHPPAHWADYFAEPQARLRGGGRELSLRRKDGSEMPAEIALSPKFVTNDGVMVIAAINDLTARKRAEEALQKAQAELARVTRAATLGVLTASIAHEINQPLAAVVNNASACLRWLAAQNLEEARQSAASVIADGHRAGEILARIRAFAKKAPPPKDWLDINETVREVIALARSEAYRNSVALEAQLSDSVPLVLADRIQLQQVILNLIMNAIEALSEIGEGAREVRVSSERVESTDVLIAVRDSGPGLDRKSLDRLFEAFYTTKPQGLGMGLAISRSIIESHGGRLWAMANAPQGAVFQFTLPVGGERRA